MTRFAGLLDGIEAVTFDVDDTLWDFQGVMRSALMAVLEEMSRMHPEAAGKLSVDRMIAIRDETHERLWDGQTDLNTIREESIRQALKEAGVSNHELGSHLTKVYFDYRNSAGTLFPDVRPALELLARIFTLGLLSNGNTSAAALGLDDLVSFELFAEDHGGIEKPDRRLFDIAVGQAGYPARRIVHVGDSWENDVIGAANAGLRPVWLNRTGEPSRGCVAPAMRSLEELAALQP